MLSNANEMTMWAKTLQGVCQIVQSPSLHPMSEFVITDIEDNFLLKSSQWKMQNQQLLNCRKLCFLSTEDEKLEDPSAHLETLLEQAFKLSEASTTAEMILFLNGTCKLQDVDLTSLFQGYDLDEKVAFLLNLYHLMVLHGFIVLGAPTDPTSFASFFTQVSYNVGEEIFSLAELEHRIIRAGMTSPQQSISKLFISQATYSFALDVVDPRLLFAVNCGAISNLAAVPIYRVETLHQQLNYVTMLTFRDNVKIDFSKKKLILPRMCKWYQADFGGTVADVLHFIRCHSSGEFAEVLSQAVNGFEQNNFSVQYEKYPWKCCRMLKLLEKR